MSITKKTVIFLSSFLIALIFMSIIFMYTGTLVAINNIGENIIGNIVLPLLLTIGFFLFILIQSSIRYMLSRKILLSNTVLLTVNVGKFNLKEKLWINLFLVLIFFASIFRGIVFDYTFMIRILLFVIASIIINVLLKTSNNKIKVYFLRNGILITGFDLRVEIPFGQNIDVHNDSGYYSYNDIESYLIFPNRIELFLINEFGKIDFKADGELKRQVTGLMVQNKIELKKFE